jgi:hypothetical protein
MKKARTGRKMSARIQFGIWLDVYVQPLQISSDEELRERAFVIFFSHSSQPLLYSLIFHLFHHSHISIYDAWNQELMRCRKSATQGQHTVHRWKFGILNGRNETRVKPADIYIIKNTTKIAHIWLWSVMLIEVSYIEQKHTERYMKWNSLPSSP